VLLHFDLHGKARRWSLPVGVLKRATEWFRRSKKLVVKPCSLTLFCHSRKRIID
jgi:hypothetical protein